MAGILEGTKVIEMGHLLAVPAATAILADWGADVIKLEPPGGEMARGIYTLPDREDPAAELPSNNWYFQVLNRNKKGLALNQGSLETLQQRPERACHHRTNGMLVPEASRGSILQTILVTSPAIRGRLHPVASRRCSPRECHAMLECVRP